jgi:hypothetical protein
VRRAVERVLQALHEDPRRYIPTSERVRWIAEEVAPEEDPKALAREVLKEARRRVRGVVQGLWQTLGIHHLPPLPEVEKLLWRGDTAALWCTEDPPGYTVLDMGKKGTLLLPFSLNIAPRVYLEGSKAGDVVLSAGGWYTFFAQEGRAFLSADTLDKVEEVSGVVRVFSPLLQVFGLGDLEEAVEELKGLKEGEVRAEGARVLARRGGLWTLLFGTLFGPPALDAAFVLGEELVFSYPQDLEVALRGRLDKRKVDACEIEVRWEGEVARNKVWYPGVELTDRGFPQALVRKTAKKWLDREKVLGSAKIRVLLQELAEADDPLEAPRDPEFFRRAQLRALARL